MKWLRASLDSAGWSRFTSGSAVLTLLLIGATVGLLAFDITDILALSVSSAVGAIGLLLEALNARARSRRANIAALWPEVVDSIISAISSGSSITESIIELSEEGPTLLRQSFQAFGDDVERGNSLARSFENLKIRLGDVHSDRLIELLYLASEAGGAGLIESLRNQVKLCRQELAFRGEISSKLGWITGTAKIAVCAPWLIVALLSTRPVNASAYASAEGSIILMIGLGVSVFAFRLVQDLGALPANPRVFA